MFSLIICPFTPCPAPQGERISPQLWGAVGLGLLGSCLVAFGGITAESSDMAAAYPDELKGVCLLLAASLAISVATIRLGTLGKGEKGAGPLGSREEGLYTFVTRL